MKTEEGGDDVKSSWPLCPGLHTCYNGRYRGKQDRKVGKPHKAGPSSDWRLKLAFMKVESLVIADQLRRGEYVPALYTPPVKPRKSVVPEVANLTARGEVPTVRPMIGTKS